MAVFNSYYVESDIYINNFRRSTAMQALMLSQLPTIILKDFGTEGANFTVEILRKEGIRFFGVTYGRFDSSQVVPYQ